MDTHPVDSRVEDMPFSVIRADWGAIAAGAVVAMALQGVLTVLGAAIAFGVMDAYSDDGAIKVAAAAWWIVTGLISLAAGGAATGCLLHGWCGRPMRGAHGFLVWCTVAVIGAVLSIATGSTMGSGPWALSRPAFTSWENQRMETSVDNGNRDTAREHMATAAWWTTAALVLGALATVGGAMMMPSRETYRRTANRPTGDAAFIPAARV